jgi:FkbM family methyltransferase
VRSLRKRLERAAYLCRHNCLATVLRFEWHQVLKQKRTVCVEVNGVELALRTSSPDLKTARASLEEGEFDEVAALLKQPEFGFIIDAGGYIGTSAIVLARMFPSATIVSIEPSSDSFELLARNVKPFRNVVPVNKALLASPRSTPLRDRGTGEWGYTVVQEPLDCKTAPALHTVSGTTVEALMREFGKDGVDLLKLDIEGSEKEVLAAAGSWIARTAVVVAELHDRIADGCSSAFYRATAGFQHRKLKGGKVLAVNRARLPLAA